MYSKLTYSFNAKLWRYSGESGWHFVSIPKGISKEIRNILQREEEGWGRLKATARIHQNEWRTAIWYDTKLGTYLLPIKAKIRAKERIIDGDSISIILIV